MNTPLPTGSPSVSPAVPPAGAPPGPPVAPNRLGLTIGPVLYHWPRQALMDFYAEVVETAADTVVIGEVVCARRRELRLPDWLALGRDLAAAGKTVVLAAQALIETEADLRLLEDRKSVV